MSSPLLWVLDTNIISKAIRQDATTRSRLVAHPLACLAITAVNVAELEYGSLRAPEPDRYRARWRSAISPYAILSFDQAAALVHARLRLALRAKPIGERDLLIAAIAIANRLGVVTNNLVEFARVPGLRCEDWSRAA